MSYSAFLCLKERRYYPCLPNACLCSCFSPWSVYSLVVSQSRGEIILPVACFCSFF